jgi:hypothetical protein
MLTLQIALYSMVVHTLYLGLIAQLLAAVAEYVYYQTIAPRKSAEFLFRRNIHILNYVLSILYRVTRYVYLFAIGRQVVTVTSLRSNMCETYATA